MHTLEEEGVNVTGKGVVTLKKFVWVGLLYEISEIFLLYIFWNQQQDALAARFKELLNLLVHFTKLSRNISGIIPHTPFPCHGRNGDEEQLAS